jgi:O-antigen ligase
MHYLLALTIYLAPTYTLRFQLFGLPVNILLVWLALFFLIFFVWLLAKGRLLDFLRFSLSENRILLIGILVFAAAGLLSFFVGGVSIAKLGQLLVLFLEPLGVYFISRYIVAKQPLTKELLIQTMFVFAGLCGFFAIVQYFTLYGLPMEFWGNSQEPKRAIGFFSHPNGYALFIAPLLAFLIPHTVAAFEFIADALKKNNERYALSDAVLCLGGWVLGAIGLFLSLSRGGWLGLAAAIAVFIIFNARKKYIITAIVGCIIVAGIIYAVPNFRYRVLLPFYGEKSSVARLSLWHTGTKMIKDSPIVGKGLLGFTNNWYQYNEDQGLSQYPAPHNIFLNFWIDTGLLGLLSFVFISGFVFVRGIRKRKNLYAFALSLFVAALLVHGQIDVPYFKNDLALLYWFVLGVFL